MYFDPLTAWLVALISDGIIISGEHVSSSKMAQHRKEWAKMSNDIMNGSILSLRNKGYASAESALNTIKIYVEHAQKSYEIRQGYAKLEISKESFDFIIKLCEECRTDYLKQYETYASIYKERIDKGEPRGKLTKILESMQMYQSKAASYQSILDTAKKGREKVIQEEEERARKLAESDSNGVVILKSLLVIGMCIGGFAIVMAGGKLLGALALIGAAIGGYFILK